MALTVALAAASAGILGGVLAPPPYAQAPPLVVADVAFVPSGDVGYFRVTRAAALYGAGRVPRLLLTGAGVGGDSAQELKVVAVRLGVPAEAIWLENASVTTRENVNFIEPLLRSSGWKRVALITNDSHMGRASRVARRAIPDVEWIPVPVADPGPPSRIARARLQEWAKLAWYALRGWV